MAEPISLELVIRDQANKTATSTFYFAAGLTLGNVIAGAQAFSALVDGVINGVIQSASVFFVVDISGLLNNTGVATSDVEEVGAFAFGTAANRIVRLNVPAIADTLSVVGSDQLNQSNTQVAALITAMESGVSTPGGTMQAVDINEADIVSVNYAREEIRPRGKRV